MAAGNVKKFGEKAGFETILTNAHSVNGQVAQPCPAARENQVCTLSWAR